MTTTWATTAAMMTAASTSGCVVPAAVEDVDSTVSVVIEGAKIEPAPPPWAPEVEMDPLVPQRFDVARAVRTVPDGHELNYYWYYDYDREFVNLSLIFAVCQSDAPFCILEICSRKDFNLPDHNLLLVVSDTEYGADPEDPFDFPEGAAWDAIEWPLRLRSSCP